MKKKIILVDFDGTCVTDEYPDINQLVDTGAAKVLKLLTDYGHRLILYTMRSGKQLEDAEKWFYDRDIPLWDVNNNPSQFKWTSSKKIHGDICIDDRNLGTPMTSAGYVDWEKVGRILQEKGYFGNLDFQNYLENRI